MESKVDLLTRGEKFQLLDQLVRNGIEDLCKYAKQHNFLEPPYGKRPDPTPLITEEDFVNAGALHCDDKEPEFRYDYGFDPVKFLGQYLVWAHPDSVETRRLKKEEAMNRLRFRVAHARKQLETEQLLRLRAQNYRSGIIWGPLALVVSVSSVRLSLCTFRASTVLLEVAADRDFTDDVRFFRVDTTESEQNTFVCKVDLDRLRGKQIYYTRAFAVAKAEIEAGVSVLPAQDIDFWHSNHQNTENATDSVTNAASLAIYALYSHFSSYPEESSNSANNVDTPGFNEDQNEEQSQKPKKASNSRPVSRATSRDVDDELEAAYMREKVMTIRCLGQLPTELALFSAPAKPSSLLSPAINNNNNTNNVVAGSSSNSVAGDHASVHSMSSSVHTHQTTGNNKAKLLTGERAPDYTAVLSDAFWHKDADLFTLSTLSSTEYAKQLSAILQRVFYTVAAGHHNVHDNIHDSSSNNNNNTALLWAYRDSHPRAMAALRQEELAFKQYRHDLKKYNKKYDIDTDAGNNGSSKNKSKKPAANNKKDANSTAVVKDIPPPPQLKLPELPPQVQVLLQQLPIPLSMAPPPVVAVKEEKAKKPLVKKNAGAESIPLALPPPVPMPLAPRMLYRAVPLCSDVLAIVLDLRRCPDLFANNTTNTNNNFNNNSQDNMSSSNVNQYNGLYTPANDYLGREQADWLARILRKSTAMWKVILCAKTFGAAMVCDQRMDIFDDGNNTNTIGNSNNGSRPGTGGGLGSGLNSRPATAPYDSDPNNTNSSATNAVVQPGAGGMKRQPSTGGNTNSQARFVQVLEPEKDESKSLEFVYDDVDDVFGRPKCSLQYVLARYQEKLAEEKGKDGANNNGSTSSLPFLPPPLSVETQTIQNTQNSGPDNTVNTNSNDNVLTVTQSYVSSGIVLVTGGVASAFTRTILTRTTLTNNNNNNNGSISASPSVLSTNNNNNVQVSASEKSLPNNNNSMASNNSNSTAATNVLMSAQLSDLHDVAAPTFCATYAALNSTKAPQQTLLTRTSSPSAPMTSSNSKLNGNGGTRGGLNSRGASRGNALSRPGSTNYPNVTNTSSTSSEETTLPPHLLPFCFEVSVGQGSVKTNEGVFRYHPGFDARTLHVSEPSTADSARKNNSETGVVAAPQCELSLLADGRLEITCREPLPLETKDPSLLLSSGDNAGTASSSLADRRAVFCCRLTVPSLPEDDDAASNHSADSVHVA